MKSNDFRKDQESLLLSTANACSSLVCVDKHNLLQVYFYSKQLVSRTLSLFHKCDILALPALFHNNIVWVTQRQANGFLCCAPEIKFSLFLKPY